MPRDLVPAVATALLDVVLRCLAKRRDERFAGAAELHEALGAIEAA